MKPFFLLFLASYAIVPLKAQTPDSAIFFFLKGKEEIGQRRFLPAFNDLQKSSRLDSSNIETARDLGLTAMELRKYDEARTAFLKVERKQSNDTTAIVNLTTIYFWTHQWEDATKYAAKAQKLHAGQKNYYVLGKSYYELEDYGQAFNYLPSAASEEPKNPEIPYMIARAYVDMNNYKPAIPYFQKAIALDSSKVEWIYECALTFATIYDDESALKYYDIAASKGYKKDNDFYENIADSYIAIKQPEKAIKILQDLLIKKPADLELLNSLAFTTYKLKKYDQAIDYWDRILSYDKQNARSLYMIGMAYQKKGDDQKGKQLCDRAIEMDPSLKSLKTEKKMDF